MVQWLDETGTPDPAFANEDGLVALGGVLSPDFLLRAYRAGVFPWSSEPLLNWWSPDPRMIFELSSFRQHRSVRKRVRKAGWRFAIDRNFEGVIRACASREETWITEDFIAAYTELYRRGYAHSVEVYEGEELIGGLYGVSIGAFFGGESMFHRRTDASKAAVGFLVERLRACGFLLLDAQAPTPHLASLGAIEIPREEYLKRLKEALSRSAQLR